MTHIYQTDQATIDRIVVGPVETNCYILQSQNECVVIDPGANGKSLAKACPTPPKAILATHGHGDHVGGAKALCTPNIPFYIAQPDAERAMNASKPGNLGIPYDDDAPKPTAYLKDGDTITVGSITLTTIESPGHTPGGIVLLGPGFAFTGDTIFAHSIGRTDFPESNPAIMQQTINKLKHTIPPNTILFPGHGEATTMKDELKHNPYF